MNAIAPRPDDPRHALAETSAQVGRGLADGVVEVKDRRSGERTDVALADVVAHLVQR